MDLDFIQEQLDTFATFGGNIGDALQLIPELLERFFSLFQEQENEETLLTNLSSNTSDIFGGDADNGTDEDESLSANLSS